ncbi:MAG: 50S ribosomal protein L16 [archaeon]|jgi:large subunit ribosomal protein L10e|nr:50S ribosomal protein L16 [Candidatus ainarchaeum sp.]
MGLRPAKCYRGKKVRLRRGAGGHARSTTVQRPYTRIAIKVPKKNYIGASPQLKIRQFNMGNPLLPYNVIADLISKENCYIRDNALESVRSGVNRMLVKALGKDGYFMKVRLYPSQLMRENKQAQGAGADRVSQGMTQPFGIPIGRSAKVRKGQAIYSVLCMDTQKDLIKKCLMRAKSKLPCKTIVEFHLDIKSIGTLPSKAQEDRGAAKAAADAATASAEAAKTAEATKAGAKTPESAGKTPVAKPAGKK